MNFRNRAEKGRNVKEMMVKAAAVVEVFMAWEAYYIA
jgi:hypothetical protein